MSKITKMTESVVQEQAIPYLAKPKTKITSYIKWETFEKKYLDREDGFKYEWNNGVIEKTIPTMRSKQLYIVNNLINFFVSLKVKGLTSGLLTQEADVFLNSTRHRKPDIAYISDEQLKIARQTDNFIPAFVIEIISPTDKAYIVQEKVSEYLKAGVKVIWHIYPNLEEVQCFYSDRAFVTCKDEMVCSAEIAIHGFAMTATDIFKEIE